MSDFGTVTEQEWRDLVERELGGDSVATLGAETLEGLLVSALYADAPATDIPGVEPPACDSVDSPRLLPWCLCPRYDDPELEVARRQIRDDARGGAEGMWLRLDRRARLGLELDSDEGARAAGREGVLLLDSADLAVLLQETGSGAGEIRLDAGGNGLAPGAMLVAALEAIAPGSTPRVSFGIDPLGALVADGEIPHEAACLAAEAALLVERTAALLPGSTAMVASALPYAAAGADAVQQVAFTTATLVQYLRWLEAAGMPPELALPQIDVAFGMVPDFLLGVAMLRAARLLHARVAGACDVARPALRLHAVAGGRTLTRRSPWTNLLRETTQTAAAVVGGADVITTDPFDAPLGRSDALARRLARNTQLILGQESGLRRTTDPGAGSYAIETLTRQLAAQAWDLFREIERGGGMHECLHSGKVQDRVEATSHRRAVRLYEQADVLVGVSRFAKNGETPERETLDPRAASRAARARLREHVARRADPLVEAVRALGYERRSRPEGDLVEAALDAARAGATIAELTEALRPGARRERVRQLHAWTDEALWDSSEQVRS